MTCSSSFYDVFLSNVWDKLYFAELRNYMVKSSCSHIRHWVYLCAWKISR